jgi:energy-coupling factor transporter ATP-binding protein EcfA2
VGGSIRIRIAPLARDDGPRVRTGRELLIDLDGPGVLLVQGPNGAGKSVLLAAACGLTTIPQIEVVRDSGPPPLLVGQYPELQVFEDRVLSEATFAATERGVPKETAERAARSLMDRLGLTGEGRLEHRTWELSLGEKRLVLLIGALVAPAGLLALDEPTAGLDAGRRQALAAVVRERAGETRLLIATQDHSWGAEVGGKRLELGVAP